MDIPASTGLRIGHLGDLHLGRRWLSAQAEHGVNLREADVYEMSEALAEFLVEVGTDIAVIAGDLFDSVNPSTRARSAGFRLVTTLRAAGMRVIIVAGNHDHAQSSTPSPLVHLREFFGADLALDAGHIDHEGVRFHLLPYQELARMSTEGHSPSFAFSQGVNILVSHGYLCHPDIGTPPEHIQLPRAIAEDPGFDLVLLGHVHRHVRLGERIYYSGAPERLNLSEIDAPLGLWLHDVGPDGIRTHDIPLSQIGADPQLPRTMRIISVTHNGAGLQGLHRQVMRELSQQALPGAVLQVRVHEADPDLRQSAHPRQWREEAERRGALHCDVSLRSQPLEQTLNAELAPLPSRLDDGYRGYLIARERPDLVELALDTLAKVER